VGAQFTVILLAELLILFLFSRAVTGSLAGMIHLFTRSRKLSISLLVILFLPGTIIHELAHLLSAGMMMVPVGEIEILPKIENDSVHLGSVEVAQTDIFRRAIIGLDPLFFGTGVILSGDADSAAKAKVYANETSTDVTGSDCGCDDKMEVLRFVRSG